MKLAKEKPEGKHSTDMAEALNGSGKYGSMVYIVVLDHPRSLFMTIRVP